MFDILFGDRTIEIKMEINLPADKNAQYIVVNNEPSVLFKGLEQVVAKV